MGGRDTTGDKDGRAARLAEALRENLRKRKAQARSRRDPAGHKAERAEPARPGRDGAKDDRGRRD